MNEPLKLLGTVAVLQEIEYVGQKNTPKRLVVVDTGADYQSLAPVTFFGQRAVDLLGERGVNVGDEVEVEIYVGGREYNGKYYADISGRGITVLVQQAPATTPAFPTDDEIDTATDPLDDQIQF